MDCVNKNIAGRPRKEWVEENKEHLKEYKRLHYIKNKEVISKKHKEYREKNKEQLREKKYKYTLEHKEDKKKYDKLRFQKMKEQLKDKYKCEKCNYNTYSKQNYMNHLKTQKHKIQDESV